MKKITILVSMVLAVAWTVNAAVNSVQSGDFADTNTWSSGSVPGSGTFVQIITNHTVTFSSGTCTSKWLDVGMNSGDAPTFVMSGGSYRPTGVHLLREGGTNATVNQTGGDLAIDGYLRFYGTGNLGTYNYSGGSLVCEYLWYADNSHGIFNVIGSSGSDVSVLINVDMDATGSAVSEINFIFDADGVSAVTTPKGFRVGANSVFHIDGSAYTGPSNTFVLVDAGWIANDTAFVSSNLIVTGFSRYSTSAELDAAIDQLTITVVPLPAGYDSWLSNYPELGSQTNRTDDAESDGLNNLLEYALGGDPNVDDAASILPIAVMNGSYLEYVYQRRTDYVSQGLDYTVKTETALVDGSGWTNANVTVSVGPADGDFEPVTNRIDTTLANQRFVRLQVQEN